MEHTEKARQALDHLMTELAPDHYEIHDNGLISIKGCLTAEDIRRIANGLDRLNGKGHPIEGTFDAVELRKIADALER